jgi:hypothetical protein
VDPLEQSANLDVELRHSSLSLMDIDLDFYYLKKMVRGAFYTIFIKK